MPPGLPPRSGEERLRGAARGGAATPSSTPASAQVLDAARRAPCGRSASCTARRGRGYERLRSPPPFTGRRRGIRAARCAPPASSPSARYGREQRRAHGARPRVGRCVPRQQRCGTGRPVGSEANASRNEPPRPARRSVASRPSGPPAGAPPCAAPLRRSARVSTSKPSAAQHVARACGLLRRSSSSSSTRRGSLRTSRAGMRGQLHGEGARPAPSAALQRQARRRAASRWSG